MAAEGPAKQIYIFKSMDRLRGFQILRDSLPKIKNIEQIKDAGKSIWLLRESNSQPGMLTVDEIIWNKETNQWGEYSARICLTPTGWIDASNPNDPSVINATKQMITAETAAEHQESLNRYITEYLKFNLENRVNPPFDLQTRSLIFSQYAQFVDNAAKKPQTIEVLLTPGVLQAITCEIAGKPFHTPVVLKLDLQAQTRTGKSIILRKGRSYEKWALLELRVLPHQFYENFLLKRIIDRLGSNDREKLQSLTEDRLEDGVFFGLLQQPIILPSTHTFSWETIQQMNIQHRPLKCPNTQQPFHMNDVIPNLNIERFIKAWPECREPLMASLKKDKVEEKEPVKPSM